MSKACHWFVQFVSVVSFQFSDLGSEASVPFRKLRTENCIASYYGLITPNVPATLLDGPAVK